MDVCETCGFPAPDPGFLRSNAPVGHPDFGKVTPCPTCHADRMRGYIQQRLKSNQLEGEMGGWTFDNYITEYGDEVAVRAALDFVATPNYWLTLYGGYGRGKSHLLAAIHNALTVRGTACYYATFPDLTSDLRASVGRKDVEGFFKRVSHYPVLILDEIDKSDLRQWTREQAFRLFNRRANLKSETGTVMAMNLTPDIADDELGYLFSRMHDGQSKLVRVAGEDNRENVPLLRKLADALPSARRSTRG